MPIDDPQPPEGEDEGLGRESHRERTIRMRAIAALANTLVGMKPPQLAAVGLPEEIAEAVVACQGFKKNARARQLRRIGGLLRAADLAPIEAGVREAQTGKGERSRREQSYEIWRTQLLTGGGPAMTAFITAHPSADVQALRQRVRMATREPESPRGKGAARELLRMIRDLGEAALVAKLAAAAESTDDPDADEPDTDANDDDANDDPDDDANDVDADDDANDDDANDEPADDEPADDEPADDEPADDDTPSGS
jgi:ribosome-associated protein